MAFVDATTGGRVIVAAGLITKLTIKASSTVKVGDPLGYSSGWVAADADAPIQAEWIALNPSSGGTEISATKSATIDFGSGSTATANDPLYLGTTAGVYTASAPTNAQVIGEMVSAQIGRIDLTRVAGEFTAAAVVGTTAPTTSSPYGWASSAQAADIVTQLNIVVTALKRSGILAP